MNINKDQKAILAQAVEKWGAESQTGMAIEEAAEFIVAAQKTRRVGGRPLDQDAIDRLIDETADNFIMMHQMGIIYDAAKIQERIDFKINRLKGRLEASTTRPKT